MGNVNLYINNKFRLTLTCMVCVLTLGKYLQVQSRGMSGYVMWWECLQKVVMFQKCVGLRPYPRVVLYEEKQGTVPEKIDQLSGHDLL